MRCPCDDWYRWMPFIDGVYQLAWVHNMKQPADYKFWKYCPWCGKVLVLESDEMQPSSVVYPVDKMAPIYRPFGWHGHVGVDWIIVPGTPVPSIKDGEVIESAQDSNTYGGYCLILHADGYASLYAHLSELMVKKYDVVKAGRSSV